VFLCEYFLLSVQGCLLRKSPLTASTASKASLTWSVPALNVCFMKPARRLLRLLVVSGFFGWSFLAVAGTWSDDFSENTLGSDWQGDRDYFSILDGSLKGYSALPVAPSPLNRLEVGKNWTDYSVQCRINVVEQNLLICTKGALILRDNGTDGYVFALHIATRTIEVYRLSDDQMLLSKDAPLRLKTWYLVRAELNGPNMNFFVDGQLVGTVTDDRSLSGAVGVAVQDALDARFDDFSVTGPNVPGNGLELSVGEKITLTWPSALTNYVLKTSLQLSGAAPWVTVTNTPTTNGDQLSITLDPSQGSGFYILVPKSP
jgi:hypothetical protein